MKNFLQDVNAKKETKKGKNISRNTVIPSITLHEKSTKGALFLSSGLGKCLNLLTRKSGNLRRLH